MTAGPLPERPPGITVVIVDDQPLIRQGFSMILQAQADITVVGEAGDGVTAMDVIAGTDPDVVLMDIRMPGIDGLDTTRQVRAAGGRARVVILTTFGLDEYVTEALASGASGFVLKDATPDELVHAVRVVAAGDALLSPAVTTRLIERMLPALLSTNGPMVLSHGALALLTEREIEVLHLVARGRSNQEISAELHISEATVKTHVSHVLTKLGLRDRVQAVIAAYELGMLVPARIDRLAGDDPARGS